MNLVIDIGNSRTKIALFSKGKLVKSFNFELLTTDQILDLKKQYPEIERIILSAVSHVESSTSAYLQSEFPFYLKLTYLTPIPLRNNYHTPETLGLDRLAAAIGAQTFFPEKDLLVIDAGTAVTFDLVEGNGTFVGGNISPGMKTRFRALHEFTNKLPFLDELEEPPEIGRSTEEAIRAGVINGLTYEIDGMIDFMREKHPGIKVVLTGGDALFFERRLKNPIFVKSEITLIGLNRILEYNVEKQ